MSPRGGRRRPIERIRSAGAKPLRDLVGISGGEFARWIKITTPNDRLHVIRVFEMAAGILRDELEGSAGQGSLALVGGTRPEQAASEGAQDGCDGSIARST